MGRVSQDLVGGGRGRNTRVCCLPQLDQCLDRIEDILWCAEVGQSKSRPLGGGVGGRNTRLCCLTPARSVSGQDRRYTVVC